jgi:hypothetical protein
LVEVAQPILEAPPSVKRPDWMAATMVEPNENVSGSTIVWCWLVLLVYGSLLIWTMETAAKAKILEARVSTRASVPARIARTRHRESEIRGMHFLLREFERG